MSIERHEMHLATEFPTGAEEWACASCGRRMILSAPPGYQRVLLVTGDEHTLHYGDFAHRWHLDDSDSPGAYPEPDLSPLWLEAFEDLDFGNLPGPLPGV